MKLNTEYHYRFANSGTPNDTRVGKGNYITIAREFALWCQEINMNANLKIEVTRNQLAGLPQEALDDLESLFEGIEELERDNG